MTTPVAVSSTVDSCVGSPGSGTNAIALPSGAIETFTAAFGYARVAPVARLVTSSVQLGSPPGVQDLHTTTLPAAVTNVIAFPPAIEWCWPVFGSHMSAVSG